MATIKFKRTTTSTTPTGLTFGEPAFVQGLNSFYVTNSSGTSVRVGAEVDTSTSLGGAGATHNKLATQLAVKTYVDNNLASGAVTSINGVTGAAVIRGGNGISVAAGTDPDKGITITNTGVQSLTLTATTNGGLAVTGAGTTGALSKAVTLDFSNLTGVSAAIGDLVAIGDVSDSNLPKDATVGSVLDLISGDVNVDSNGTSSIAAGAIVDADIASNAAITVTKLAAYTISGHTLGNNLSTLTIGTGLGGTSYNGSSAVTITNTGVTQVSPGTGISVSASTGSVTITNTGVQSLAGTANEIEVVTAATGAVQIGLPDNVTIGGNLSVVGNLTINGTTTTVNSTTVAIQDPIFTLGGTAALGSDDNKDRGIEFRWHNGTTAKTGFFGYDDSISRFTFIPDATNSSEVFSGTVGDIQIASAYLANGANLGQVVPTTLSGNRTYTLPDHTGTVVVPANLGTSNYILKANGTTSQPTWIDATAAGFTAYNATNVTSVEASGTYYLAMASAVGTNQLALDTTATALTYNTATSTLTAGTFSGTLSGNASSATNATNATNVISTEQTTGTMYLVGMAAAGTTGALLIDATAQGGLAALSYNNATATLTAYQVEAIVDGGSY